MAQPAAASAQSAISLPALPASFGPGGIVPRWCRRQADHSLNGSPFRHRSDRGRQHVRRRECNNRRRSMIVPHSGDFRARRSRAARRAAIRRRQSAAAVVVAMLLAALFVAVAVLTQVGGGSPATTTNPAPAHRVKTPPLKTAARRGAATRHEATRLVERLGGRLPAGIEDPAAAAAAGRIILAGGLTAQDLSSTTILSVRGRATRIIGQLPAAQHDAPAATLGRFVYVFGGGDGVAPARSHPARRPRADASRARAACPPRAATRPPPRSARRLRRRRLHRHALARHDRRVPARQRTARVVAHLPRVALRGRRGGRPDRS